jgi:hypothetical protein
MNQDEDRKAGIESLAVVGILALFVALGLAAATGSWRRVAEVVVFLTVIGAVLSRRPVRIFLFDGSPVRAAVLCMFVGMAVVAQFGGTEHLTFPFVAWRMFPGGIGAEPIRYVELHGVRRSGESIEMQGYLLFPSLHQDRYQNVLEKWTRRALLARQSGNTRHAETFEEIMRDIGRAHNTQFPEQRVDRLEVSEVTLSISEQVQKRERRELWTIEGPF